MLARALGAPPGVAEVGVDPASGAFSRADWERVRQVVIEKNRLWFAYSRPMNWAFLGGDRIDQPSSHDHINPKVRWFPEEMQRFGPMIDREEKQIATLVQAMPRSQQGRRR